MDRFDIALRRIRMRLANKNAAHSWRADAGQWDESKHPRAKNGQFGAGGGAPSISPNQWQTWAASGYDVNEAMRGNLRAGAMSSDGERLTENDIADLKKVGEQIQQAAESQHIPGGVSVFRGMAFSTKDEMKRAFAGRSLVLDELTSTGTDPEVASTYAQHWSETMRAPIRAIIRFSSGNGMPGVQTDPLGAGSEEYVLPKGARFTSIRYRGQNSSGEHLFDAYTSGGAKPKQKGKHHG